MSQMPPAYPQPGAHPPVSAVTTHRTNVWGVVSIVLGVLGCIPFIASAVSVLTGLIGLVFPPRFSTRTTPVIGLILGIIGLGFWLTVGATVYQHWDGFKSAYTMSQQLTTFAEGGNIQSMQQVMGAHYDEAKLKHFSEEMHALGELKNTGFPRVNVVQHNNSTVYELEVAATFAKGDRKLVAELVNENGTMLLRDVKLKQP